MSPEDWKDELYQAYVAKWRAHEAEESDRRRLEGKIAVWLERSPDDAETFTPEHQVELQGVVGTLRAQGVELEAPFLAVDAADAVSGYTGQLIASLAASPILTAAAVAWIKGRQGRRVRIEFFPNGKVKKIEAQTAEEVLSIAAALKEEARKKRAKSESE